MARAKGHCIFNAIGSWTNGAGILFEFRLFLTLNYPRSESQFSTFRSGVRSNSLTFVTSRRKAPGINKSAFGVVNAPLRLVAARCLLALLTTALAVGIISNMKAVEFLRTRIVFSETAFAELVLWKVPKPVSGSVHEFKYRLVYVVDGVCAVRYDNEAGKGDHRHFRGKESAYSFQSPERLIADFEHDIARWNRENRNS